MKKTTIKLSHTMVKKYGIARILYGLQNVFFVQIFTIFFYPLTVAVTPAPPATRADMLHQTFYNSHVK